MQWPYSPKYLQLGAGVELGKNVSYQDVITFSEKVRKLNKDNLAESIPSFRAETFYPQNLQDLFEWLLERFIGCTRKSGETYLAHYNDSGLRMLLHGYPLDAVKCGLTHDVAEDSCDMLLDTISQFLDTSQKRERSRGELTEFQKKIQSVYAQHGHAMGYIKKYVFTDSFKPNNFTAALDEIKKEIEDAVSAYPKENGTGYTPNFGIICDTINKMQVKLLANGSNGSVNELSDLVNDTLADLCKTMDQVMSVTQENKNYLGVYAAYSALKEVITASAISCDNMSCVAPEIESALNNLSKQVYSVMQEQENYETIMNDMRRVSQLAESVEKYSNHLNKPLLDYALYSLKEVAELESGGQNIALSVLLLTNLHNIVLDDLIAREPELEQVKDGRIFSNAAKMRIEKIRESLNLAEWQKNFKFDITNYIQKVLDDLQYGMYDFASDLKQNVYSTLKNDCYKKYLYQMHAALKQMYSERINNSEELKIIERDLKAASHNFKPASLEAREKYNRLKQKYSEFQDRLVWFYVLAVKFYENIDNIRTLTAGEKILQLEKAYDKEAMLLDSSLDYYAILADDAAARTFFNELYSYKKNSSFCELLRRCDAIGKLGETRVCMTPGGIFTELLINYAHKHDIGGFRELIENKRVDKHQYPKMIREFVNTMREPFIHALKEVNKKENITDKLIPNPWQYYAKSVEGTGRCTLFWETLFDTLFKTRKQAWTSDISPLVRHIDVVETIRNYYYAESKRMKPLINRIMQQHINFAKYQKIFEAEQENI